MYRSLLTVAATALVLSACGGAPPAAPKVPAAPAAAAPAAQPATAAPAGVPAMRNFAALTIGPYSVQPMFEEEIANGHYNVRVSGGLVKAVRIWVGPEDASGAMVVKSEPEFDYYHGHVEVPNPAPADARLWIEIEDETGATHKGSTPLQMAP